MNEGWYVSKKRGTHKRGALSLRKDFKSLKKRASLLPHFPRFRRFFEFCGFSTGSAFFRRRPMRCPPLWQISPSSKQCTSVTHVSLFGANSPPFSNGRPIAKKTSAFDPVLSPVQIQDLKAMTFIACGSASACSPGIPSTASCPWQKNRHNWSKHRAFAAISTMPLVECHPHR